MMKFKMILKTKSYAIDDARIVTKLNRIAGVSASRSPVGNIRVTVSGLETIYPVTKFIRGTDEIVSGSTTIMSVFDKRTVGWAVIYLLLSMLGFYYTLTHSNYEALSATLSWGLLGLSCQSLYAGFKEKPEELLALAFLIDPFNGLMVDYHEMPEATTLCFHPRRPSVDTPSKLTFYTQNYKISNFDFNYTLTGYTSATYVSDKNSSLIKSLTKLIKGIGKDEKDRIPSGDSTLSKQTVKYINSIALLRYKHGRRFLSLKSPIE